MKNNFVNPLHRLLNILKWILMLLSIQLSMALSLLVKKALSREQILQLNDSYLKNYLNSGIKKLLELVEKLLTAVSTALFFQWILQYMKCISSNNLKSEGYAAIFINSINSNKQPYKTQVMRSLVYQSAGKFTFSYKSSIVSVNIWLKSIKCCLILYYSCFCEYAGLLWIPPGPVIFTAVIYFWISVVGISGRTSVIDRCRHVKNC